MVLAWGAYQMVAIEREAGTTIGADIHRRRWRQSRCSRSQDFCSRKGTHLYPALSKDGYREKFTLGLLTASGSLGLLLPPALPMRAILGIGVLIITYVPWLTTGILTMLGR